MAVKLEAAPDQCEPTAAAIPRDDVARPARQRRERKAARITIRVEHACILRQLAHDYAVQALVDEKAGLLAMLEIDDQLNAVFGHDRFSDRLACQHGPAIIQSFLPPPRADAAFDNP